MSGVAGRSVEEAALDSALEGARGGRLGLVLVTGEAGIGKSYLVAALVDRAAGAGVRVLTGDCLALGRAIPYLPFVEMLRDAVRGLSDGERTALLGPGGDLVASLLGIGRAGAGASADAREPSEMPAELARLQLFEAVLRMMERMAARTPLLVVIEDIQWADPASLDLLVFLVRNLRSSPVLLVLTARAGGSGALPDTTAAFAAGIERYAHMTRLELAPLDRPAVSTQLGEILGRPPDPELVALIHRRSGGNPLFAAELLAWSESGGTWSAGAPPRLRDLVAARLVTLPPEAHGVLRLASAAGRMVDDELLVEATGLDAPMVRAGIRAAIAEGLLVPASSAGRDGYAFRHDLVREAVAAELLPGERARLHEAFALALTTGRARVVDQGELAYHWDAAGEPARALQAHIEAGVAARAVYGFETAQQHFERALELWPTVPAADDLTVFDRADLMQAAAMAAAMAGNHRRAIELEREVIATLGVASGDPRVLVALEGLRRSTWESGDTTGALAEAEQAATLVGDGISKARAAVLAHLAGLYLLTGDIGRARTVSVEALDVAGQAGAREEQALAGGVLGWSLMYAGHVEEALWLITIGAAAAEDLGEVRGRSLAADHLSRALAMAGRMDDAAAAAERGVAMSRASGLGRTYGGLLAADAARCLLALGRVPDAAAEVEAGLGAGPVGPGHVALLGASALVALEQDRLDDAEATLREAAAMVGSVRDIDAAGWLAVGEMTAALRRGDPLRALATFRGLGRATPAAAGGSHAGTRGSADPVGGAAADGRADADAHAHAARGSDDLGDPDAVAAMGLVTLGAAVGPLVRVAARAVGDASRLARASGTTVEDGVAADRERIEQLVRFLRGRDELAQAFEVDIAIAEAELAQADAPADPGLPDRWRAVLSGEAARAVRCPSARAYASLRLAEVLVLAPGGRTEAGSLVRDAAAVAAASGHAALEAQARLLARRARLPLDGGPGEDIGATDAGAPATVLGLTEREAEVLRLVAAGLTNREIGERLFISPKTASVHVSAILAKLGVDGRLEAALVAQQLGLVEADAARV